MVGVFALLFVLAGFGAGFALTRSPSFDTRDPVTTAPETTAPETTEQRPVLPGEDVRGEDIPDLPRYPDSVRTAFRHEEVGGLIVTDVEYLAEADLDQVREFYRESFRDEEWAVSEADFSRGRWTFFVSKEEREAVVRLEEQDIGVVSIRLELSEPIPEETATEEPPPDSAPPQSQYQYTPQQPAPQQPVPQQPAPQQPAPQQPAPAPSPSPAPAPAPTPDYGDDGDDGGDDGGDDDGGEGGDD